MELKFKLIRFKLKFYCFNLLVKWKNGIYFKENRPLDKSMGCGESSVTLSFNFEPNLYESSSFACLCNWGDWKVLVKHVTLSLSSWSSHTYLSVEEIWKVPYVFGVFLSLQKSRSYLTNPNLTSLTRINNFVIIQFATPLLHSCLLLWLC